MQVLDSWSPSLPYPYSAASAPKTTAPTPYAISCLLPALPEAVALVDAVMLPLAVLPEPVLVAVIDAAEAVPVEEPVSVADAEEEPVAVPVSEEEPVAVPAGVDAAPGAQVAD